MYGCTDAYKLRDRSGSMKGKSEVEELNQVGLYFATSFSSSLNNGCLWRLFDTSDPQNVPRIKLNCLNTHFQCWCLSTWKCEAMQGNLTSLFVRAGGLGGGGEQQ